MSRWGKAIFAGIAIEGILFAVSFAMGGWGPCGLGSPVGQFIMWLHYPAVLAMDVFAKLRMPDWSGMPFFLVVSAAQWTLIVYTLQRWKLR